MVLLSRWPSCGLLLSTDLNIGEVSGGTVAAWQHWRNSQMYRGGEFQYFRMHLKVLQRQANFKLTVTQLKLSFPLLSTLLRLLCLFKPLPAARALVGSPLSLRRQGPACPAAFSSLLPSSSQFLRIKESLGAEQQAGIRPTKWFGWLREEVTKLKKIFR